MTNEAIDRLHADAVCALGLYLHGDAKTDRVKALKVHEDAVDALASGAAARIRERDATIARLEAERDEARRLAHKIGKTRNVEETLRKTAERIAAIALAEIARLRSALAAASADLAGGDAREVMVRTGIDIVLAAKKG